MRVRYGNGRKPATRLNKSDRFVIQVGDAIPENVTLISLNEECALANSELRARKDGPDPTVYFILLELIPEIALHPGQCRP